jgi:hypothetical protein
MKNWFIGRILKWIAGKFDGYKTIIGGLTMVLSGAVGVLMYMFPQEGVPAGDLETSLALIASGFATWGIGGKLEKLKNEKGNG